MTRSRTLAAILLAALAGVAAVVCSSRAQPQGQPPGAVASTASTMNLNVVVLDPAHGGPDTGAVLGNHVLEKDVNLAFAARLRAMLASSGFTVLATREADSSDPPTADQRADAANRTHAVACIVLHATGTGSGVHVYTSELQPAVPRAAGGEFSPAFVPVPWDMAQTASVPLSTKLASDLQTSLAAGNLPVVVGKAPVRPLDSLMCPAVAIEIAPLGVATPVTDADYQQRVASAVAAALRAWRTKVDVTPANGALQQ